MTSRINDGYHSVPTQDVAVAAAEDGRGSTLGAFINFTKGMFGCGVLTLAHGWIQCGLWGGMAVFSAVALVCTYTMCLAVRCLLEAQKTDPKIKTYSELAGFAFGWKGVYATNFAVVGLELLFATGFLIVIGDTAATLSSYPAWAFKLACFPFCLIMAWIKWLKDLWAISLAGFLIYCTIMGIVYDYGARHMHVATRPYPYHDGVIWRTLPVFFSTAIYGLEGICQTLPIVGSMRRQDMAYQLVCGAMFVVYFMFCMFGMAGYYFGLAECTIIVDCLPENGLSKGIKVALCVAILMSYAPCIYPATEILERITNISGVDDKPSTFACVGSRGIQSKLVRTLEVLFTLAISLCVPNFSQFVNVVGSFVMVPIGFILPPILYVKVANPSMPLKCANYFLACCGFAFMFYGTYLALLPIVQG